MSLWNSFRVRGVGGTAELALAHLFNRNRTPSYILSRMVDLRRYDRLHNVETAGLIETADLKVESESKAWGTRYGGASPSVFKETMDRLPIDHRDYTFIDIGSGKGAALFQASDYPFREIIGVEYAPELHEVALRNIRNFRSKTVRCRNISAVCEDGGAYRYPDPPWVLFFNSPFGLPIWKRVIENLQDVPRGPRTSYLVYMNYGWLPDVADFVMHLDFLRLIHKGDTTLIFEFTK